MTLPGENATDDVAFYRDYLQKRYRWIEEGKVDGDAPGPLYTIASTQEALASSLAVLGEEGEARETIADAASSYLDHIDACWRGGPDPDTYVDLPAMVTRAIICSLIGGGDEQLRDAVRHAEEVGGHDASAFALGSSANAQARFKYVNARLWGAIARDDGTAVDLIAEHRAAAEADNPEFLVPLTDTLAGIANDDPDAVRDGIHRRVELHEQRFADGYDRLHEAVATVEAGLVHLAARRGISVAVESDYLPPALLPEDARLADGDGSSGRGGGEGENEDERVADPLDNVDVAWNEETGALALLARVEHDADRELAVSDLPENEYGTIPTAKWYDAVSEAVAEHPELVGSAVRQAIRDGSVERNVVVRQPRSHSHLTDESFRDVDVDEVQFFR